jgi:hypothetical protein
MTSDGTRVVYRTSEVYSVPSEGGMRVSLTDGPGYLAQPDGPTFDQTGLTGRGRFVLSASLTPDGVHVLVLVRDHPTLNLASRLHVVPVDGSAAPRLLVGPLASPLTITRQAHAAAGRLLYSVANAPTGHELFSIPFDGSGAAVRVAKRLELQELRPIWALTPDELAVVFCGEPDSASQNGVYVLPSSGGSALLLEALGPDAEEFELSVSSDSNFAVLRRRQSASTALELVGGPLDGSAAFSAY